MWLDKSEPSGAGHLCSKRLDQLDIKHTNASPSGAASLTQHTAQAAHKHTPLSRTRQRSTRRGRSYQTRCGNSVTCSRDLLKEVVSPARAAS